MTTASYKGGRRRHGSRRRTRRGGSSSAATYEMGKVGTTDTQLTNANNSPGQGFALTSLSGQSVANMRYQPTGEQLSLVQKAGRRRRKRSMRRRRRGGSLLDIVGQAAVPFGLLGLQQTFSKRRRSGKHGGKKSRRRGSRRR